MNDKINFFLFLEDIEGEEVRPSTPEKKQRVSFDSSVNDTSDFESAAESVTLGEVDTENDETSSIETVDLAGKMDSISIASTPPRNKKA